MRIRAASALVAIHRAASKARSLFDPWADKMTASDEKKGRAGCPLAEIVGSVATAQGVVSSSSPRNHGPLMTMAARPELNSVTTVCENAFSGSRWCCWFSSA